MPFAPYGKTQVGNCVLRSTTLTSPGQMYAALATAVSAGGVTITEVSGFAYARQAVNFAAPVAGVFTSSSDVVFPQATGAWGTVTYVVLYDAPTGGNAWEYAPMGTPRTITAGMILELLAGQVIASF